VNAALLRALPYRDSDRLVYVWSAERARGINRSTVSIPDLRDWRQQNRVFDGLAGWWSGSYNLSGGDEPRQVAGWTVSPNFLDVLDAQPELGRGFATGEGQPGNERVVVLSHSLWMGALGGDPESWAGSGVSRLERRPAIRRARNRRGASSPRAESTSA
jgi:hypothetical protein